MKYNETPLEHVTAVVNSSDNNTTVSTVPTYLAGVHIQTTLSAQAVPFKDGSSGSTIFSIPASTPAGTWLEAGNMPFPDGIYVDPDDSATAGTYTLIYKTFAASER